MEEAPSREEDFRRFRRLTQIITNCNSSLSTSHFPRPLPGDSEDDFVSQNCCGGEQAGGEIQHRQPALAGARGPGQDQAHEHPADESADMGGVVQHFVEARKKIPL